MEVEWQHTHRIYTILLAAAPPHPTQLPVCLNGENRMILYLFLIQAFSATAINIPLKIQQFQSWISSISSNLALILLFGD